MKKRQLEVRPYFEAVECECGGLFHKKAKEGIVYSSNPPKAIFFCSLCQKEKMLSEPDWPTIKYDILTENSNEENKT